MTDILQTRVREKIEAKYQAGVEEHGGLADAPNDFKTWIIELQAEAIDTVHYCEKLLMVLEAKKEIMEKTGMK